MQTALPAASIAGRKHTVRTSSASIPSRRTRGMDMSQVIWSGMKAGLLHTRQARLIIGLLVVATVTVAGCGGTNGGPATGGPPPAGAITEFSAPNDPTK